MTKKKTVAEKVKVEKKVVRKSESFASYYTNDTQIQTGPWDVRLIFARIEEVNKDTGIIESVREAEVHMSPQHALRVHTLLGQQLTKYGATFGPIPQPKASDFDGGD